MTQRVLVVLFALALALPFAACDTTSPTDTPAPTNPGGENPGGENEGEENEGGESEGGEEENQDPPEEGEVGGLFRIEVEPVSTLLGGATASFTGSAVFYQEAESGRFVIALADDDVLNVAYPFEFVVFSTPDGRPEAGVYPLSLDLETSFMGGYAQVRGTELIDVDLPLSDEVYRLPPSTLLQTFGGTLTITASGPDRVEGTLSFQGFPVNTEAPPLFVQGESRATGFFEAVLIDEADAPDVDLDLYLPDTFEFP